MKDPAYIPEALSRQPSKGLTMIPKSQAGPMIKMVSRLLKPKLRMMKKGFTSADIHIKHKKVKFW